MPGHAPWSPAFVGLEPVAIAAEDYNGVRDSVTPGVTGVTGVDRQGGMKPHSPEWGGCGGDVDMNVRTRILDMTRFEQDGTRARITRAAEGEGNECRCSY